MNGEIDLVIGGGLLAAGVVIGLLLSRFSGGRLALKAALRQERDESTRYREAVARHFGKTSDRFRELTLSYSALYAELAEGARELCADRLPTLGDGFEQPLKIGVSDPATPPDDHPPNDQPPDDRPNDAAEAAPAERAAERA